MPRYKHIDVNLIKPHRGDILVIVNRKKEQKPHRGDIFAVSHVRTKEMSPRWGFYKIIENDFYQNVAPTGL
jgi:hypothetical protein